MKKPAFTVEEYQQYGLTENRFVENPTIEDVAETMQKLTPGQRLIYNEEISQTVCITAQHNRIWFNYYSWTFKQGGILLDAVELENSKEIWIHDDDHGPVPVYETVSIDYALQTLVYYLENQSFPKDTLWEGPMSKLLK